MTFTTPDARLFITDPGGFYPIPGDGKYLVHFDGGFPVTVLLPGDVTAFGADFSGGIEPDASYNATLTVNLVGGGSYVHNFSGPGWLWTFFGVTYSQPISSLVYDDGGPSTPFALHEETLDNVTFGNVIPEPGIFAFFALGALLLGWRWRRIRSS
ncbi:MAG: PEP-CTERM sorting domain-containing protein [Verrucomicrobia bacterium]|nr:PEP-CTERM sorting domain-containing protein [Verrucomicrobiota bacterium]